MRDFFDSLRFRVLVLLTIFLAGMMAYAGANGRLTAAPQEVLSVLVAPFQWVGAQLSGGASAAWDKYASIDEIMQENQRLNEENAALRQQLVDYDRMKAENDAYASLAGVQREHEDWTFATAFVIGRDSLDLFGGFTVDRGTKHGVARGDTVLDDNGYLVGTVIEANLTSCRVLTILHPSFSAAVAVSRTRDNGILTGSSQYAEETCCTMTNLSRDSLAVAGDQLITTGLGGVYPADILVGTVRELQPEAGGKSIIAVVRPGADILNLTHVSIITARNAGEEN